jgi:hypothetical protein
VFLQSIVAVLPRLKLADDDAAAVTDLVCHVCFHLLFEQKKAGGIETATAFRVQGNDPNTGLSGFPDRLSFLDGHG